MATKYELILILGRRGTGKTTLALKLAEAWPRRRVIAHDPMAQMTKYPAIPKPPERPKLRNGVLLLLDEVDLLAPPSGYAAEWIRDAVHYGRHEGYTIIACARRPANVHRDMSALATVVYLGRITEPRDLKYCADAWGVSPTTPPQIPDFHFLKIIP